MLLTLLRIPLTAAFAWYLYRWLIRGGDLEGADIVMLMAYGLFGSILLAILWAPVIGEKLSAPITSTLTEETSLPSERNRLVRSIGRLQRRGWHRLALPLILLEGMRHPTLPLPALLGLRSARPGSFLEKLFAREVYNYNNIQNCLAAYRILKERHHCIPPPHGQPEVNLAILSLTRESSPERKKYEVKPLPPPTMPQRNRRIKLFQP
jgi:hypothetical protein